MYHCLHRTCHCLVDVLKALPLELHVLLLFFYVDFSFFTSDNTTVSDCSSDCLIDSKSGHCFIEYSYTICTSIASILGRCKDPSLKFTIATVSLLAIADCYSFGFIDPPALKITD